MTSGSNQHNRLQSRRDDLRKPGGRSKAHILFLSILAAIMLSLLVGKPMDPAKAQALCLYNVNLPGPFRLLLNCDSAGFMRIAADPSTLLEPESERQSRPLFIIAGYLSSLVMTPVAAILQPFMPTDSGPTLYNTAKIHAGLQTLLPVYLGYLMLNVCALWLAFRLYLDAVAGPVLLAGGAVGAVSYAGGLLAANDVVKAFVWSPHVQMLNILVPTICSWLLVVPRERSMRQIAAWSGGIGVGLLAYPVFAILLPTLLLAQISALRRRQAFWLSPNLVIASGLGTIFCAVPTMLWYAVVKFFVGSYLLQEASKYHEVVWLAEAWRSGPGIFVGSVAVTAWFFIRYAAEQAIPVGLLLLMIWIVLRLSGADTRLWFRRLRTVAAPIGVASAICLIFYTIVGWRAERLAYAAVPPLVMLAGAGALYASALLPSVGRRWLDVSVAAVICAWSFYIVCKAGPLS